MLIEDFNYDQLADLTIIPKIPRKKSSKPYLDIVTAFDIETTRLPDIEQSFMYIWQFQFGERQTVTGRTWEEFFSAKVILGGVQGNITLPVMIQSLKGAHSTRWEWIFSASILAQIPMILLFAVYYLLNDQRLIEVSSEIIGSNATADIDTLSVGRQCINGEHIKLAISR